MFKCMTLHFGLLFIYLFIFCLPVEHLITNILPWLIVQHYKFINILLLDGTNFNQLIKCKKVMKHVPRDPQHMEWISHQRHTEWVSDSLWGFHSSTASWSLISLSTHGESGLDLALFPFHVYPTFIWEDLQWQTYDRRSLDLAILKF